jgi:broad specificity phosphatase PhoE
MICTANTFIQHGKKKHNLNELMEGERELTDSSRLVRQQRNGVVAVMRKRSSRDVAAAGSSSGRCSPASSAALEGCHQPFNMHPVESPRKIRRHREVPFNTLGGWL